MWGKEITQLWFVTFVTHNSRRSNRMVKYKIQTGIPVLFSPEDRILIGKLISEACSRYKINLVAKVILRDHAHLIVEAENEDKLNELIRKIKGYSSYRFQNIKKWESGAHIWAQKFHRKPIHDEDALENFFAYIENNPDKHKSNRQGA